MTFISSNYRILLPNTGLSERVVFRPLGIHFSSPKFSVVREVYAGAIISHFCRVSLAAGRMGRGKFLFFLPPVPDSTFLLADAHGILLLPAEFRQMWKLAEQLHIPLI